MLSKTGKWIGTHDRSVQIGRADTLMMGGWVMLGEIVSPVGIAGLPENMELALAFAIMELVKAHVHSL